MNVRHMYFHPLKFTINNRQHLQYYTIGKASLNKRRNKVLPQRRATLTYVTWFYAVPADKRSYELFKYATACTT
jgi:hypothetical protein